MAGKIVSLSLNVGKCRKHHADFVVVLFMYPWDGLAYT